MSDEELAQYLGIDQEDWAADAVKHLPAAKRALYDHTAKVEAELKLYQAGLGPMPKGVIVCR